MKKRFFLTLMVLFLVSCGTVQAPSDVLETDTKESREDTVLMSEDYDKTENVVQSVFPRNVAIYMFDSVTAEMGEEIKPEDFFDKKRIEREKAFDLGMLSRLRFDDYPSDEEQYKPGVYRVTIFVDDNELSSSIKIQDTIPPSITVPGEKEYERGTTILYRVGVEINDNSKQVPVLEIDDSEVNSNMAGTYIVHYSARDAAGNIGYADGKITITDPHVPGREEVDKLADQVLEEIISPGMADLEKARAVFDWCQNNIRITGNARKDNELFGAYDGLYFREGDCYTSYATSTWLLKRCGLETIDLSKKLEDATHYWCLVNAGDGWYHFDCSHLKEGYHCFMQTDAQVNEYAQKYLKEPEEYIFEQENVPERETKIIYSDPILD